uniref:Uncharacterized protein n=1 Tax=Aegilops tauschii subsp. strangulata TaxID=200361 RepID=A0A453IXZ8_AEGTS
MMFTSRCVAMRLSSMLIAQVSSRRLSRYPDSEEMHIQKPRALCKIWLLHAW